MLDLADVFQEYDKDYSFAGESHDFWELLYIDKGSAVMSLNGTALLMSGGQMILYEPGAFHTIAGDGHNWLNTIVVSFDCRAGGLESLKNKIFFAGEGERAIMAQVISEAKPAFIPVFWAHVGRVFCGFA